MMSTQMVPRVLHMERVRLLGCCSPKFDGARHASGVKLFPTIICGGNIFFKMPAPYRYDLEQRGLRIEGGGGVIF